MARSPWQPGRSSPTERLRSSACGPHTANALRAGEAEGLHWWEQGCDWLAEKNACTRCPLWSAWRRVALCFQRDLRLKLDCGGVALRPPCPPLSGILRAQPHRKPSLPGQLLLFFLPSPWKPPAASSTCSHSRGKRGARCGQRAPAARCIVGKPICLSSGVRRRRGGGGIFTVAGWGPGFKI